MAQAVNPPQITARKADGMRRIANVRKRNSVHKNATKKAKIISEIKAERFIFGFLTDFSVIILEKDKKI